MATQAQIDANRRNAQKSTGPKTSEGNARASLNALKHGIRARAMVDSLQDMPLFDEDPQEFADLVQAFVDEFQPEGPCEERCVEGMAINQWRLRRLTRAATAGSGGLYSSNEATKNGHTASAQSLLLDGPGRDNPRLHACNALPDLAILEKLNRYETSLNRQIDRFFEALLRLQSMRAAPVETRHVASPNSTSPNSTSPNAAQEREISAIRRDVIGYLLQDALKASNTSEFGELPDEANSLTPNRRRRRASEYRTNPIALATADDRGADYRKRRPRFSERSHCVSLRATIRLLIYPTKCSARTKPISTQPS